MNRFLLVLGLVATLLLTPSCGGDSPTESSNPCRSLAGTWVLDYGTRCNTLGHETVVIAQTGCSVSFVVPGVGSFTGQVADRMGTLNVQLDASCGGQTTGGLVLHPNNRDWGIDYGGTATGDACCRHGAGAFTR
jgi:hypothetical protein